MNQSSGDEENYIVYTFFYIFIIIIIIIIISIVSISISFVALLNFFMLTHEFPLCPHPAGGEGEGWAIGRLVLSCQLPG